MVFLFFVAFYCSFCPRFDESLELLDWKIAIFQAKFSAEVQKMALVDTDKGFHEISQLETGDDCIIVIAMIRLFVSGFFYSQQNFPQFLFRCFGQAISFLNFKLPENRYLFDKQQKKSCDHSFTDITFFNRVVIFEMMIIDFPNDSSIERIYKLKEISILPYFLPTLKLNNGLDLFFSGLFLIFLQEVQEMLLLDDGVIV